MSETSGSRSDYWRDYSKRRYAKNTRKISLQVAIRYYRKKKEQGLDWIPKPHTKIYLYCQQNNLDMEALIQGTQKLNIQT